jgi:hypothetical protein
VQLFVVSILLSSLLVPTMQPMASPFPRKIGSALAAFEDTINKNKVNCSPGDQSLPKDAKASPCIVSSWKKKNRCSTPSAPATDAIDSAKALNTPCSSIKERMAALSSINKLPFSEAEDTADTAEAKPTQVPDDQPTKDSETSSSADTTRERKATLEGAKKGVSDQNSRVELASPRLSSAKYLRTYSVLSTDDVTDIASITDPVRSRKESESLVSPIKKVPRRRVELTVQCANDGEAEVQKAKQLCFPTSPAKTLKTLRYLEGSKKLWESPSDFYSSTVVETETSNESQLRPRSDDSVVLSTASPMKSQQSLLSEPSTLTEDDNDEDPRQSRWVVKAPSNSFSKSDLKGDDGDCSSSADTTKESPRLAKGKQQSNFQSGREVKHDISLEIMPGEPLPSSTKKSTQNNHVDQASAKAVSERCLSGPSRSSSQSQSPDSRSTSSRHRSGAHRLSPVKTSNASVGTIRSILKREKSSIERYEEQSRDIKLETSPRSGKSLIRPVKSSLRRGSSKFLRVTFADGVVVPRHGPRRNSMMSICTDSMMSICADKDTLPKQPRRHSMSDVEEVRRKSNRLQDPALRRRRARRSAVKILDFVRRKLRRLRFVKIIAATRIQALFRGGLQRMRHRVAILEQRLAKVEEKHKRQLSRIQTKKWKIMEANIQKAEEEIREHDLSAIDRRKVVEELRRENSKIREQNSTIREQCTLLRKMNGQIESTLQIHNDNVSTMREAIGVLAERNEQNIRLSKNYERRNEKVKQKALTAENNGTYESNFRKNLEQTTADMIEYVSLITGEKVFVDMITAMRLFAETKGKN